MKTLLSKITIFFVLLYFAFNFSSCISYKKVPYFQDLDSTQVELPVSAYEPYKIQTNDILGIYISSLSETTADLFAVPPSEIIVTAQGSGGFLVNDNGEITIKTIGVVPVENLTTLQLQKVLYDKVAKYVTNPTIVVKVLNFKVSINGEVANAGVFTIPNGKVNLLEALTMAGDLKISGKRENILVLRHDSQERLKIARLDLTSKDVFKSPYFYLQNNDVVYVEPNLQRVQRDENFYRNVSVVASLLSVLSIVFVRVIK